MSCRSGINRKNHCLPFPGPSSWEVWKLLRFRVVASWGRQVLRSSCFWSFRVWGRQSLGASKYGGVKVSGASSFGGVKFQGSCRLLMHYFLSKYKEQGFPKFPFFEVWVLLLRIIVAARLLKVYQGHTIVPGDFFTRPQTTRKFPQLSQ